MLEAKKKARESDPEKHRRLSIANLPKDCNGSKNGNWKGGITAKNRGIRWSKQYKAWRKLCFERDGKKCKLCGETSGVQVHHIIAMSENPRLVTLPMNGITLCKKCHYAHDEAWQGKRFSEQPAANSMAFIYTIPHLFQAYNTVGNWQLLEDGTIVIFVSQMKDPRFEMLVVMHELVETVLCKQNGVTQKQVDDFDLRFEKERGADDLSEPGDDARAPYRLEHCFATAVERMLCAACNVNWADYEKEINDFPNIP
jgi:hypothetical protein